MSTETIIVLLLALLIVLIGLREFDKDYDDLHH